MDLMEEVYVAWCYSLTRENQSKQSRTSLPDHLFEIESMWPLVKAWIEQNVSKEEVFESIVLIIFVMETNGAIYIHNGNVFWYEVAEEPYLLECDPSVLRQYGDWLAEVRLYCLGEEVKEGFVWDTYEEFMDRILDV